MTDEIKTTENNVERVKTYAPHVDIFETGDNIIIAADMPGVDENSIDITLEKNVLSIEGRVEPAKPNDYTLAYAEFETGHYRRSFTLSDVIDQDHIAAGVKDGVLNLTLPKAAPAQARKIAVQAA